jgi:hypothetical protein
MEVLLEQVVESQQFLMVFIVLFPLSNIFFQNATFQV